MALLTPVTADNSETFDILCQHFLQHEPLGRWLMNHDPYATPQASDIDSGIAFCCTFPVPSKWSFVSSSFAMGEMMIPVRTYGRFVCGIIVAATNFHKYAACISEQFVDASKASQPNAFRTSVRRIVCDMGAKANDVINLIDFAWMDDSSLIVSTKVLVPPVDGLRQATCVGSFAIYSGVVQRGKLPRYPKYMVSYAEVPHCPFCSARDIPSGCICTSSQQISSVYVPPHPTPAPSSHLITVPPESSNKPWAMRIAGINKKPTIRISVRRGSWRRDANGLSQYTLNRSSRHILITANFCMSTQLQMHALRQVAVISTSFGGPVNVASARLLHDVTAASDARDDFRKRYEINTEILNALVPSEKQEPVLSGTEEAETSPSYCYDAIDFSFDSSFISPSLTTSHLTDKTVCDKFFPYRPSVNTASHHQFSPLSNRATAQFSQSLTYNSAPVNSVQAFLDLTAATAPHRPPPPPPHTPAPICIGTSASPVTPAVGDPVPAQPADLQHPAVEATKRVRHIPSSGVCDVCGKYFFKSGALVRHTRSAHPEVAVLPREPRSSSVSSSGGASSGGRHPTGRLDCPRCSKTFSQQGSLNRHLRSIHEARKLHCRYCDLAFGQAFDLKRHQKRKHPGSVLVVPPEALPRFARRERPLCEMR